MHMGGKISACGHEEQRQCGSRQRYGDAGRFDEPSYVSRNHMPADVVEKERTVQMEIMKNDESLANKPEKVLQGIVEGRLSKSLQEMCLVDQPFFKDPNQKVSQILKAANTEVESFVRYAVGEGLEKREENFAEEVAKQIGK